MPKPSETCPKCDRYTGGGICAKCADLSSALLPLDVNPADQAEEGRS